MINPTSVPVVDLAPFSAGTPEGRRRVVEAVRRACEEIGFLAVTGHGVPADLVRRIRAEAAEFFALPLPSKERIKRPSQEISRGYNRMGDQALAYTLGKATPPDLQESFAFGQIDVPLADPYYRSEMGRIFFAPNLWPDTPAGLRETVRAYHAAMAGLAATIMRIFALALNLDEDFFAGKIDRPISLLRIIHYPGQETPPAEGQLRCGAHTDYGTLTILYGDDTPGGLQVQGRRAGEWIDVHPAQGSFVINIGDLMARWTNDRWTSTLHRVVNPPRESARVSRISMPYFHQPNYDCLVECLPTCLAPGATAKYPPITSGANWLGKHMKARHMDTGYDALARLAG